ncbi:MAG: anthranilate synthase component I, partial [Thermodesulfobacteriota bacterium]
MISPDFNHFCRLARKGNLIALTQTISADIETPVSSFLKIADHEPHAFLLESAEQEEIVGRYSFLGIRPEAI